MFVSVANNEFQIRPCKVWRVESGAQEVECGVLNRIIWSVAIAHLPLVFIYTTSNIVNKLVYYAFIFSW